VRRGHRQRRAIPRYSRFVILGIQRRSKSYSEYETQVSVKDAWVFCFLWNVKRLPLIKAIPLLQQGCCMGLIVKEVTNPEKIAYHIYVCV
jgi:hypothetical protein